MKKIIWIFAGVLLTQTACDLQPKILSFPDSVGEFISARYPALLADPNVNPEIYNSAATDYGVYAAPDLNAYGKLSNDEYVIYASVNDYAMPAQDVAGVDAGAEIVAPDVADAGDTLSVPMYGGQVSEATDDIIVVRGDTMYSLAKKHSMSVQELAAINNLSEPYILSVGQRLAIRRADKVAEQPVSDVLLANKPTVGTQKAVRVQLREIVVEPKETLYSISRKYSVPVNDLAVMNNLSAPFSLHVGQKLRVPALSQVNAEKQVNVSVGATNGADKNDVKVATENKKPHDTAKKISSDPSKKLPAIGARSSSKFSWPVRGKILSNYGAKNNGLFNDGINIGAKRGTAVNAAENGVVAYAGNEVKGMGNLIIIQHSDGWMTVYAHMDSMNVRRGARVKVGQQIGTVGETGKVDSPQLHFEIRKGTKAYNPSSYLKK